MPIWEAFGVSTGVVALSEIGDKTQLLALLLAARFRGRAGAIVLGILVATLANHAAASAVGAWLQGQIAPDALRWALGASFLAVAAWTLKPDALDDDDQPPPSQLGVFGITALAFFLAEMGDKTQIATVMLAAQYGALLPVTAGTTLGMMLANVPVVLLGERAMRRVPLAWVRRVAAAVFAVLGMLVLAGVGL